MSGATNDRSGLSPSARALLEAARDADGPTTRDRERVRRALAMAIAASAGTAGATVSAATGAKALAGTASGASAGAVGGAAVGSGAAVGTGAAMGGTAIGGGAATATGLAGAATVGLFTKVAIAVVAIGVGSTAIVTVNHYASQSAAESSVSAPIESAERSAPHDTTTVTREAPEMAVATPQPDPYVEVAPPADAVVDEVAPVAPAPHAIEATPRPSVARRRAHAAPAQPTAEPESTESTLVAEMVALHDAIRHEVAPAQRLLSVDAHAARFPEGELAGERERARRSAVHDLCAQGSEAVARYLASHPSGSSASLLRETCAPATH